MGDFQNIFKIHIYNTARAVGSLVLTIMTFLIGFLFFHGYFANLLVIAHKTFCDKFLATFILIFGFGLAIVGMYLGFRAMRKLGIVVFS